MQFPDKFRVVNLVERLRDILLSIYNSRLSNNTNLTICVHEILMRSLSTLTNAFALVVSLCSDFILSVVSVLDFYLQDSCSNNKPYCIISFKLELVRCLS